MKAKTIIAVTLSVCLVCTGGGYGIYYYVQNNKTPVEVMPVSYLSTQYYGGSSSISGTASSDVSQQVQLTGENNVKEVYVEVGDQVHVGDRLMAYDMTLTELDLEMERLNKATLGLRLEAAQEELDKLYNTTPVERNDTALVVSNENTVSMAGNDETIQEQTGSESDILGQNSETETLTEAQTQTTEAPQTEQSEQSVPDQTETEEIVIPLNPQSESSAPETVQTEQNEVPETLPETQTNPAETLPETQTEIALPAEGQNTIVPVDTLDYDSAADDGEGTKEKPFIFYCTENAVIKGSFLNLVRGWDEEGTKQIAGGAYVIVAVRATDAADGKQRLLYLDGNSDKRLQGYRADSEWRFTTQGLEILVDQEGNRVADGQIPELIQKEDFEKEFADKTEETQTETTMTESQTQEETLPQTETGTETLPQDEWMTETVPSQTEMIQETQGSETEQEESETSQPETVVNQEEIKKLESMITQEEMPQTETEPETEESESETETESEPLETESETESETEETETESETELWIDLATLPNASVTVATELVYASIDKGRYSGGSGTKEDPYLFVCEENAKITGGFLNRVMGFDKQGLKRDMEKSCYVRLEIRENEDGSYTDKVITSLLLDGTVPGEVGFVSTDIWIFGATGLQKQENPQEPEEPDPEMEELAELTYESLGDEEAKNGTYYKGSGTKEDPFVFRCMEGATVFGSFINRVLGYDETGENKISDGYYVVLEIKNTDPEAEEEFFQYSIDGPELEHEPYSVDAYWFFTREGLIADQTPEIDPGWDDGYIDDGGGGMTYTSEELKAAIRDQEALIKTLTLDERESDLKIQQYEKRVEDGVVLSSINGVVKTVGDPETGESNGEAFIVVTSDSGMYIVGNVSELNLETVDVGDEVSVQSLETGMQYSAVITEISPYPDDSNTYYGYGTENTNASYYPFKAYVEEAEGLTDMTSVTISISADPANLDTIYLQMAYIRTENGQSYVYKAGEDGTLKKQYVKTGQIIYSSYMEIKEGLTMDDSIAFPYGSDVTEGAKTQASDIGYY